VGNLILANNPHVLFAAGGGGGPVITLGGGTANSSQVNPTDAWVGWRVNRDGKVYRQQSTGDNGWTYYEDWHETPAVDAGDDYEVRFTKNSGDVVTHGVSMGVWYALSSNRQIQYEVNTMVGAKSGNFTIEIRDAATQTLQDSGVYTMSCDVDSGA
jgi:hypothetical protein